MTADRLSGNQVPRLLLPPGGPPLGNDALPPFGAGARWRGGEAEIGRLTALLRALADPKLRGIHESLSELRD